MGQHNYDDDDEEAYTPRRIWPTPPRYVARVLGPREYPPAAGQQRLNGSPSWTFVCCAVGLVVFACSAASLVITALYIDSALGQVRDGANRITGLFEALADNTARLARLASLLDAWRGNATLVDAWWGNATLMDAGPPPGGY